MLKKAQQHKAMELQNKTRLSKQKVPNKMYCCLYSVLKRSCPAVPGSQGGLGCNTQAGLHLQRMNKNSLFLHSKVPAAVRNVSCTCRAALQKGEA